MQDVLLVYKQVEMQFDEQGNIIVPDDYVLTITVSYDEGPGYLPADVFRVPTNANQFYLDDFDGMA